MGFRGRGKCGRGLVRFQVGKAGLHPEAVMRAIGREVPGANRDPMISGGKLEVRSPLRYITVRALLYRIQRDGDLSTAATRAAVCIDGAVAGDEELIGLILEADHNVYPTARGDPIRLWPVVPRCLPRADRNPLPGIREVGPAVVIELGLLNDVTLILDRLRWRVAANEAGRLCRPHESDSENDSREYGQ